MIMRLRHLFLGILLSQPALGCSPPGPVQQYSPSLEAELRQVDMGHSRIAQSGDVAAMIELLHPSYLVHLPNGQLFTLEQSLAFARSGALSKETHRRTQERVLIHGATGVVIGVDHLDVPPPLARHGERTRRYTNIYVRQDGRWRLLARHFHLIG
ncbi:MAG TPA: nuclear transport factor 2 family protein [Sphingomicrobium sp.]|nr:nuclear transport factor 2 family protein [Sphingomicrobium sp.]